MQQPDPRHDADDFPLPAAAGDTGRFAALGGAGFLIASAVGDLVIGPFPGPGTTPAGLVTYYDAHHGQVLAGGMLLALSGVLFALFGAAVWARVRQRAASPLLAGLTMTATVLVTVTTLIRAGTYGVLGSIGAQHAIAPAALQAWHIMGSAGSLADSTSIFLFLLTAATASISARAMPRWIGWPALVLAVLQLLPDPAGFLASLIFLLWTATAGVAMMASRRTPALQAAADLRAPVRPTAGSSPTA